MGSLNRREIFNMLVALILLLFAGESHAFMDNIQSKLSELIGCLVILGKTLTLGAIIVTAIMFLNGNPKWSRAVWVMTAGVCISMAESIRDWIFIIA